MVALRLAAAAFLLSIMPACGADDDLSSVEDEVKSCNGAHLDAQGKCKGPKGGVKSMSCCTTQPPTKRRNLDKYTCPKGDEPIKVAFFDADSTLRVSKSGAVTANHKEDVNVLPFAATSIGKLRKDGWLVAVVSNQGGVASGKQTLESAEGALIFMAKQLSALGGTVHYVDCAEKMDGDRKPETGMATRLDEMLEAKCGRGIDIDGSQMVGDSGYKKGTDGPHPDGRPADDFSNADRFFAENLGVPFHEPTDWFAWRDYDVFNIASENELEDFLAKIDDRIAELEESGDDAKLLSALKKEVAGNRKVNGL